MKPTGWTRLLVTLGSCSIWACSPAPPREPEPAPTSVSHLLPARVRRLSNAEYESSVRGLLEAPVDVAARLPPDSRLDGFTQNDRLFVHPAWASRLAALVPGWAHEFVRNHPERLCPLKGECARSFSEETGARAFRRPLSTEELRALVEIHAEAGRGQPPEAAASKGAEVVLTALLQSPSMLYVSEKGRATSQPGVVRLDDFEIASALSYMLRGAPPDGELLDAARKQELGLPARRRFHALRLLADTNARHHFRRFVTEWLEVDQLALSSKDPLVARDYDELKARMLEETHAFIDEVMVHRGASISSLLDSGFSSVSPALARFYGFDSWGPRVPSRHQGRLGVLQQASFLSAHAHSTHTSPVLRGDFVLRRLLCVMLPRPGEIGIETVPPPPSTTITTRARFSNHTHGGCSSCHQLIDPLGYAFENFDAAGRSRASDNGHPIDTTGAWRLQTLATDFADSAELTTWLATEPVVESCFRRYAFRFFSSQADPRLDETLEEVSAGLPASQRSNLLAWLVAYAESDAFILRRSQP